MSIDYEAEYNNRARVPEHGAIIAGWAADAARYRVEKPPRTVPYGVGERNAFDLFDAGAGPPVMFVHGGYWQALDKSYFSHLARGLNLHGVSVAMPSYDLCPRVRVGAILAQVRSACAALSRMTGRDVILAGHSAGGHMAACLLASEAHVPAASAISGLFELAPLIATSLNQALRLDADEAAALSPRNWPAPAGKTLDAVVGAEESSEFLRQSASIVAHWGAGGAHTRYEEIPGANHFTVLAPLTDPDSPMVERLVRLALRRR